ncbi:MAG: dTDP-4-dehydrorhamnose 3,5-epimerase [Bacillota bacterium]
MKLIETKFADAFLLEANVFPDERGFFTESYNKQLFKDNNLEFNFVQDNHSYSVERGVIRGLHYQVNPIAQTKLVRVLAGAIYDVIVDIRKNSKTYGKWQGFILSEENKRQLLVPRGFAHGFCTLVANTQVFYKVDNYYSPEHESGIIWNDPILNIEWPISIPILSEKDAKLKTFAEAKNNFE